MISFQPPLPKLSDVHTELESGRVAKPNDHDDNADADADEDDD